MVAQKGNKQRLKNSLRKPIIPLSLGSPSPFIHSVDQSCVLGELSIGGFFLAILLQDCELQQHDLLVKLRYWDDVWPQGGTSTTLADLRALPAAACLAEVKYLKVILQCM